jgi:hypothetical protein
MSDAIPRVLARIIAFALGLLWGFFVAFNVVFSDVFGASGMLSAVAFVLAAYFGLGLAFGAIGPKTGARWTVWLATPGMLFPLLMLSDNPGRWLYTLGVILAVLGGTLAGAWSGASLRRRLSAWSRRRNTNGDGATPVA